MTRIERIFSIKVVGDDLHIYSTCVFGDNIAKTVNPIIAVGLAEEFNLQTERLKTTCNERIKDKLSRFHNNDEQELAEKEKRRNYLELDL